MKDLHLTNEEVYLTELKRVFENGLLRDDRTGVSTYGVFGAQLRYNLAASFPILTTKAMDIRSVLSELLWFLEGSTNERRLAELRYGKPRSELTNKKTIWTSNATAPYWLEKGLATEEGDLGRVYGAQWRDYIGPDGSHTDQIEKLIHGLKTDPYGRRHVVSAWNPAEIDKMALPPCHIGFQCYVHDGVLSLHFFQRSVDKFLGEPYNIVSYGLLLHMLAQVCGYRVGELLHSQTDAHIYTNHMDQVGLQLTRIPLVQSQLMIDTSIKHIDAFKMSSFEVLNYQSHPSIPAPMAQ